MRVVDKGLKARSIVNLGNRCKVAQMIPTEQPNPDSIDVLLARNLPHKIPFDQVSDRSNFDSRVGSINVFFVNIIGVNRGDFEFCPDDIPPSDDQRLAFLWLVKPELAEPIAKKLKNKQFASHIMGEDLMKAVLK